MATLSALLSVARPSGMWESIIWAFEGFTNNYVWAIVLLTVIIRLIWSPLDTYNRYISTKNAKMQAVMKPELDKIQAKYGNDKQLLNQKTNEVYKKHNFNMMGSCSFMLIFFALNMVVFFTLFSGLNKIAAYKIYDNYDNLKENYANCLNLTNENSDAITTYITNYINEKQSSEENAENPDLDLSDDIASLLEFRVFTIDEGEEKKTYIGLFEKTQENTNKENVLAGTEATLYLTLNDFKERDSKPETETDESSEETEEYVKLANNEINKLITNLQAKTLLTKQVEDENGESKDEVVYTLLNATTDSSMPLIVSEYKATQEKFLWIQNIWIADSPTKDSVFNYKGFVSLVGKTEKGEDKIFNSFMPSLSKIENKKNGYFILPILCVFVSFLSSWISQLITNGRKKKDKQNANVNGQKQNQSAPAPGQGKVMSIVLSLVFGLFALLYNSVFAIYMLVSQLISTALMPLQQLIVKKISDHNDKKRAQKLGNEIDYRRKA